MKSFLLAFSFLTILRTRNDAKLTTIDFSRSLWWFPAAGLAAGATQCFCASIGIWTGSPENLTAIVIVAANLIITGGLHLDGVADTADGFGAGMDRESVLRIMKDARIGVFAVAAIVLALLARYAAYQMLLQKQLAAAFIIPPVISRSLLPAVMTILRYARTEGTGSAFSHGSFLKHAVPSLILGILCVAALAGSKTIILFVVAAAITILFSAYSFVRIRGFTGDTLGCQVELVEIAILFAIPFSFAP